MAAGRNVGRVGASPIAVPIIISSPSASPTNSILKRQGMSSLQEEEELLAESAPETPTPTKVCGIVMCFVFLLLILL